MTSIQKALDDPKGVFKTPSNVLSDQSIDNEAKRQILNKWHEDAYARSTAQYEGMEADEPTMLHQVDEALKTLDETAS